MDESHREREMSFLAFEIGEIESAELIEGEDEELESLFRKMENSQKIVKGLSSAYAYTSEGDESVSENLSRAIRMLSDIARYDETVSELYGQLSEIDSLLNDFNRGLSDHMSSCEFSEEELYETQTRLNEINRLKAKYGSRVADILSYCEEQREKLARLSDYENYMEGLKKELAEAQKELEEYSDRLSELRKEQGKALEHKIEEGLADLNFADVRFEIVFGKKESYSAEGTDDVEFSISLNPGQPMRPLVSVASGGELSRIMLAIKAVMADKDETGTLIFDEIDVGISGRTAQKVSEKMALIGRKHQVICITHLAQIAAMADVHFLIEKTVEAEGTATGIRKLSEAQSVEELARILGGAKITDAVLNSAKEMKELAREIK